MPQTKVDMVKLAQDVGATNEMAKSNSAQMDALRRRLDQHVVDQNTQFTKIETRMERDAQESTRQHNALAGKVEDLTHSIGGCISSHVETAVAPVITEVKNHRKVMWSVAGGMVAVLLMIIGYLITQGVPWNTALAAHSNGVVHERLQ